MILATLACWIPAVMGFGIVLALPRKNLCTKEDHGVDLIAEPLFGLMVLSVLANTLNFFIPVNTTVSLSLMIAGWVLFWMRFRTISIRSFSARNIALLFLWLVFVSFWATQTPRNPDTGLYHMQSIKWINESAAPFGLANVHDRLGFNSSWFSVAALIQMPVFAGGGVNGLSISALAVYFFGVAAFRSWSGSRLRTAGIHSIYLTLAPLIFLGSIARRNISSPSPDFAVLLLSILITYLAIETLLTRSNVQYRFFQMIVLALFGFTLKPSALPLFLFPFSALLPIAKLKRFPIRWRPLVVYTSVLGGTLAGIWLLRGIVLSGYMIYPVAATRLENLLWAVPVSFAERTSSAIRATAKMIEPPQNLPFAEWFMPWLAKAAISVDVLMPAALMIAGIAICVIRREKTMLKELGWVIGPLIAAILFWFFSAPDIRFAAGYLWSLGLLCFSAAVAAMRSPLRQKQLMIFALVLCFAIWVPLRKLSYFGFPPLNKARRDVRNFLLELPIPRPSTTPRKALDGHVFFEPSGESNECWLSNLPCGPYFNERLRAVRTSRGEFEMFYFPKR